MHVGDGEVEEVVWLPRVCQALQHHIDMFMTKFTLRPVDTGLTLLPHEDNARKPHFGWLLNESLRNSETTLKTVINPPPS